MAEFSVAWHEKGPNVLLGGTYVSAAVEMVAVGKRGGPSVFARFEIRDGVPETVDFRITASPKGRAVRTIDLRGWTSLENVATNAFLMTARRVAYSDDGAPLGSAFPENDREFWATRGDIENARASRSGPSDEELGAVAQTYTEAINDNPTEAVQKSLGYHSRRTAARRVEQARARGFLPKTTRGKKAANREDA